MKESHVIAIGVEERNSLSQANKPTHPRRFAYAVIAFQETTLSGFRSETIYG